MATADSTAPSNEATESPRTYKTSHSSFFSCNPDGDKLFTVSDGVPLVDALEQASCFLAAALCAVGNAAHKTDDESVFGAAYLVEMAKAVVDSASISAFKYSRMNADELSEATA